MRNGWILKASLAIGAVLTAFVLLLQQDPADPLVDSPEAAIDREELRVQAARASVDAKPSIGESHLPPYDAEAAIAREESALRRLSSPQRASP